MKLILSTLAALLLVAPGMAMNETDSAYLEGIQDGYALGYMVIQGQTEPAYEAAYNEGVAILNRWMDSAGYTGQRWANLQKNSYQLPPVFGGPIIMVNESNTGGIVHAIDGTNMVGGAKYTTNDMNLLPDPGNMTQIENEGGAWLGGI